ncbi:unnamed protein product, partial [Effrenium voratum]
AAVLRFADPLLLATASGASGTSGSRWGGGVANQRAGVPGPEMNETVKGGWSVLYSFDAPG